MSGLFNARIKLYSIHISWQIVLIFRIDPDSIIAVVFATTVPNDCAIVQKFNILFKKFAVGQDELFYRYFTFGFAQSWTVQTSYNQSLMIIATVYDVITTG